MNDQATPVLRVLISNPKFPDSRPTEVFIPLAAAGGGQATEKRDFSRVSGWVRSLTLCAIDRFHWLQLGVLRRRRLAQKNVRLSGADPSGRSGIKTRKD